MYAQPKEPVPTERIPAPDFDTWFEVQGDVDDFIFYGQAPAAPSQR